MPNYLVPNCFIRLSIYRFQTAPGGDPNEDAEELLLATGAAVAAEPISGVSVDDGFFSAARLDCCPGFMANLLFVTLREYPAVADPNSSKLHFLLQQKIYPKNFLDAKKLGSIATADKTGDFEVLQWVLSVTRLSVLPRAIYASANAPYL